MLVLLAGCSACQIPSTQTKPGAVPAVDWPPAPRKLSLDRNWEFENPQEGFRYAVIGDIACTPKGKSLVGLDLSTGLVSWVAPLESDPWLSAFTDGLYFYAFQASSTYYNQIVRFLPDGTPAGTMYLTVPGFETDYKNSTLLAIQPFGNTGYSRFTIDGSILYLTSLAPSKLSTDPALPGGGGVFRVDLSHPVSTNVADEYTLPAKLIFSRTNPVTKFSTNIAVFSEGSNGRLVVAEEFWDGYGGDTTPFRLDENGNPSPYGSYYDVDYAKQYLGIHCIDSDTGVELWEFCAPYGAAAVRLFDTSYGVLVTDAYESYMLDKTSGVPIWSHPFSGKPHVDGTEVGNNGYGNTFLTTSRAYMNKGHTDTPNDLEAIDLATGQRIWGRQQFSTQGFDVAVNNGILYAVNQSAVRIYNATTGDYLGIDESIHGADTVFLTPNTGFVFGDDLIVFGTLTTWSIKMNYELDIFSNLVKKDDK